MDILNQFENYLSSHSYHTRLAYTRDVSDFNQFLFAQGSPLSELTISHVKAYVKTLKERKISVSTFSRKIAALKCFFLYLNEHHNFQNFTTSLTDNSRYPLTVITDLIALHSKDKTYSNLRVALILYLFGVCKVGVNSICLLRIYNCKPEQSIIQFNGQTIVVTKEFFTLLDEYLELIPYDSYYLFPIKIGVTIKPIARQAIWSLLNVALSKKNIHLPTFVSLHTPDELKGIYFKKHPRT